MKSVKTKTDPPSQLSCPACFNKKKNIRLLLKTTPPVCQSMRLVQSFHPPSSVIQRLENRKDPPSFQGVSGSTAFIHRSPPLPPQQNLFGDVRDKTMAIWNVPLIIALQNWCFGECVDVCWRRNFAFFRQNIFIFCV